MSKNQFLKQYTELIQTKTKNLQNYKKNSKNKLGFGEPFQFSENNQFQSVSIPEQQYVPNNNNNAMNMFEGLRAVGGSALVLAAGFEALYLKSVAVRSIVDLFVKGDKLADTKRLVSLTKFVLTYFKQPEWDDTKVDNIEELTVEKYWNNVNFQLVKRPVLTLTQLENINIKITEISNTKREIQGDIFFTTIENFINSMFNLFSANHGTQTLSQNYTHMEYTLSQIERKARFIIPQINWNKFSFFSRDGKEVQLETVLNFVQENKTEISILKQSESLLREQNTELQAKLLTEQQEKTKDWEICKTGRVKIAEALNIQTDKLDDTLILQKIAAIDSIIANQKQQISALQNQLQQQNQIFPRMSD